MPILIVCGGCAKRLRVPDALAGKTVKCPHCAHKSRTPAKTKAKTVPVTKTAVKPAAVTKAAVKPVTKVKKPQPSPPLRKKPLPKSITPPPDAATEETVDDLAPPKPVKPAVVPPAHPRVERSSSTNMLVLLGGGFIGIAILGAVLYFFLSGAGPTTASGGAILDGQPLALAKIILYSNDEVIDQADTDANGKFAFSKAPPGKYKVCVFKYVMPDGQIPVNVDVEELKEQGFLRNVVPLIYENREETPLELELKAGDNKDLKFALDTIR